MRWVLGMLLLMDVPVLAVAAWMGGDWLANTQVAYVTSALVMGASMFSYARMVRHRLAAGAIPDVDDREMIDQIDDPHGLYEEEVPTELEAPATAETIKAAIQEEKARSKENRRSVGATLRDSRAAMSFSRLGAYGVLIFGFFYLRGHHLLHPIPYLIGLSLPIAVIVGTLMLRKEAE